MIPPICIDTLLAWLRTGYFVQAGSGARWIELRLGRANAALAALHARCGVSGSILVLCANPFGRQRGDSQNRNAERLLRAHIAASGLRAVAAEARPDEGDWPSENGVLVLGGDAAMARELCRRFDQHGALVIPADAIPRLALHPDAVLEAGKA